RAQLGGAEAVGQPAVGPAARAALRALAVAAEPDGDRPLHRVREHAGGARLPEAALEAQRGMRPHRAHQLDGLAAARGALVEGRAEGLELLAQPAEARA